MIQSIHASLAICECLFFNAFTNINYHSFLNWILIGNKHLISLIFFITIGSYHFSHLFVNELYFDFCELPV